MARRQSFTERRRARRFPALEAENAHSGLGGRERICVMLRRKRRALMSSDLDEFPEDAYPQSYRRACGMAADGRFAVARRMFERVAAKTTDRRLKALISNDLAALAAMSGPRASALERLRRELDLDPDLRHRPLKSGRTEPTVNNRFAAG
jgi:hypothetical protein